MEQNAGDFIKSLHVIGLHAFLSDGAQVKVVELSLLWVTKVYRPLKIVAQERQYK